MFHQEVHKSISGNGGILHNYTTYKYMYGSLYTRSGLGFRVIRLFSLWPGLELKLGLGSIKINLIALWQFPPPLTFL